MKITKIQSVQAHDGDFHFGMKSLFDILSNCSNLILYHGSRYQLCIQCPNICKHSKGLPHFTLPIQCRTLRDGANSIWKLEYTRKLCFLDARKNVLDTKWNFVEQFPIGIVVLFISEQRIWKLCGQAALFSNCCLSLAFFIPNLQTLFDFSSVVIRSENFIKT